MASSRLERIGTIYTRVEGLLTKGAIKPDDRPLWFDVYRAFPPLVEPKFAKPKPEIKPIRPILYPEDNIRAKFHSKGYGLGAINMISQTETQTKRLIQQYTKLRSEGVSNKDLIEKAAEIVGSERQLEATKAKITAESPGSVSAKVLAEVDIKNIFSEK
ncbi:28S ribosomal protein S23, mitochondrial [Spodoptera litura]|uniref:Small ribosomal subunit protein mS23 n=1 Tax=Spodoptera litura TaxID=69820 RepID=A0A9J7J160_SPOLT|nr:28S ribosomal protein S23, mitochondrial [Spodoptera litura]